MLQKCNVYFALLSFFSAQGMMRRSKIISRGGFFEQTKRNHTFSQVLSAKVLSPKALSPKHLFQQTL